jgi:signal transduction histidine kinase
MMCSQSHLSPHSLDLLPFAESHPVLECLTALNYRSGNLETYLTEIVLGVSRLIRSDWSIVTVCEGDTGQVVASSIDLGQTDAGFSVHGTLAEEVVQSGRSLIIEDSRKEQRQIKPSEEYLCYLGIPLKTSTGEVIGTICSFLREPRSFTESEVKLVELFSERAATAIENYRLYQQQLQFNAQLTQEVAACSIGLKQSQDQLIERERLAAIGEFTAMIVHEIRNPLTTVVMGLRHAQKVLHSDADQERLDLSLSEFHRLNHLLYDILCYAKPQVLQCSKLNINEFLNDLLSQIRDLPEAADRQFIYDRGLPEYEVIADSDKLKQVFINLFKNACEAIAPHETVSCRITDYIDTNQICISIHNGGTPIPPDILPQLATPFCSTKSSGTGLGLAISKRIITSHDGELAITSSSAGTTVSVYLPIVSRVA